MQLKAFAKISGVSLIEILVTILILGIGLLGVAALQVSGVSSNQEGFFTSQATFIAEDLSTRIRSGRLISAVVDPKKDPLVDTAFITHLNYITQFETNGPIACGAAPPTMCRSNNGSKPNTCDQNTISQFELWEICDVARNTLPDGRVRTVRNNNKLTVVVDWAASRGRKDMGSYDNFNDNCETLGVEQDRNCIIMELIP